MAESPDFNPELRTLSLSHSNSRRRRTSTDSSSPEFEFWMLRNPSFPAPNLVSADELFVDGVLRPLHRLPDTPDPNTKPVSETPGPNTNLISEPPGPNTNSSDPNPKPISEPRAPDPKPTAESSSTVDLEPEPDPELGPELSASAAPVATSSKRWMDIFKKAGEKKAGKGEENDREKDKKKERKGGGGASPAELNINIWPFARSRSAGNAYTRPKSAFGASATRKVNSAPCSRSNSAGESKSRKWPPASPGRGGVHLGRSSPVWQFRRGGAVGVKSSLEPPKIQNGGKGTKMEAPESRRSKKTTAVVAGGAKARVLNLNVPMCIGYRSHLSCKSDVSSTVGVSGSSIGGSNRGGGDSHGGHGVHGGAGSNLFNLRSLFTKKVY